MSDLLERLRHYIGVLPATFMIVVFMLAPLTIIFVYSFLTPGDYGGVKFEFSTEAYTQLLFQKNLFDEVEFDTSYLTIAFRSIWVATVAVLGSLALGFPAAYYIAQQPESRRNTLLLLITIPFWTNLLIRTYCWILVLRDTGLINNLLIGLGLTDEPITMLYTEGAIALGLVYTYVPFMVLPIYAALERLDKRLIEASRDLYANRWTTLRHVTLPLASPGIVAGAILVFIPALGAFIAPDLLGGGKKLMLGSLVQLQFSAARDWPFGSALTMVIMSVVLICLLLFAVNQRRNEGGFQH
ncbi:spermidine/putrescine transport system permease protein [Sagittula marina]|uniref:Spermidine/putrescine transport system permease protein n=1 Tax=Sagittula marina TaxID=943940 RepID=A0A7W6DQ79_9RHOB|nr:ABC transporter permease [Sagittula marina]MBB3987205.1 spermidine/putrescine transport system permease protein [Sagittula marina]